jgi:hypothetical protein
MTKRFNVRYTCENCGHQTTAETAFNRWMRGHPDLDSRTGIIRTDTDHIILRYKTALDGRSYQLIMIVEVKEFGASPDPWQIDILSFLRQIAESKGRNLKGAPTTRSRRVFSKRNQVYVRLRFYGVHLLQFEKTGPLDSDWIKWNGRQITTDQLVDLLAMNIRPDNFKPMIEFLRDRHAKPEKTPYLKGIDGVTL